MSAEGIDPPREWLAFARRDLEMAELLLGADYLDGAAFHAQQAMEKVLKAALVRAGVRPPRTHDLVELAAAADLSDLSPPESLRLYEVARWSVVIRYPSGDEASPAFADVKAAIEEARAFAARLEKSLGP